MCKTCKRGGDIYLQPAGIYLIPALFHLQFVKFVSLCMTAPPKRSASAAFGQIAQGGEAPAPRSRAVPLSRVDESSSVSVVVPPAISELRANSSSLYKVLFEEKGNGLYICRLCCQEKRADQNSTGNLGKHLQKKHREAYDICHDNANKNPRASLGDVIKRAEMDRTRAPSMDRFVKRIKRQPAAVASEARWILWLTKRGIAFDALQDPLFAFAREVCEVFVCLFVYFYFYFIFLCLFPAKMPLKRGTIHRLLLFHPGRPQGTRQSLPCSKTSNGSDFTRSALQRLLPFLSMDGRVHRSRVALLGLIITGLTTNGATTLQHLI